MSLSSLESYSFLDSKLYTLIRNEYPCKLIYMHFPHLNSKPVMDLLVTLCASYHLNPTDFTVEVLSPNKNNISFKPNSPIGLLEVDKIVLKPKGVEEKIRRPYMPEVMKKVVSLKLQQQESKKEKKRKKIFMYLKEAVIP